MNENHDSYTENIKFLRLNEEQFKLNYEESKKLFYYKENFNNYIKKDILLNNFIKSIKLNYNPNILTPQSMPNNKGLFIDLKPQAGITADNIAEFAYPLVQYVHQTKPDYIIACDRGGRMIGLAVHLLYQQLYGGLPTKDHGIRFRRISKSVPTEETARYLAPDVREMSAETPNPKVLVLDDWVVSGGTKQIAEQVFNRYSEGQAQVYFGVMRGSGADVSGNTRSSALPGWKDTPEIIGVDYQGTKGRRIKSHEALKQRQRIADGVKVFAHELYKSGLLKT